LTQLIQGLVRLAFPTEQPLPFSELTVVLTDNTAMPSYKEGCFGVRQQTDVVSQAYAAIPGLQEATAELVINVELAGTEGPSHPGGASRELALYLAHGLDHLAGHDDDTSERRQAMRDRETTWLDAEPSAYAEILTS